MTKWNFKGSDPAIIKKWQDSYMEYIKHDSVEFLKKIGVIETAKDKQIKPNESKLTGRA